MTDDHPRPTHLAAAARSAAASAPTVTVPIDVVAAADLVPVDAAGLVAGAGPGVGAADELIAYVLGEMPALAVLEDRKRLLAAAWLASLRSARTRRSYAADLLGWRAWLTTRGVDVLAAGRVHVDL